MKIQCIALTIFALAFVGAGCSRGQESAVRLPLSSQANTQFRQNSKPLPAEFFTTKPGTSTVSSRRSFGELKAKYRGEKPRFDFSPGFHWAIPGQLTVIFQDHYELRPNGRFRFVAKDSSAESKINEILRQSGEFEIIGTNISEARANELERKAEAYWDTDIPNLRSMVTLLFSDQSRVDKALNLFRGQSCVRSAYRSPRMATTSAPVQVTQWQFSTDATTPTPPNDSTFQDPGNPEKYAWYHFNRHKVFESWQYTAGVATPTIAVIDTGFDVNADGLASEAVTYLMDYAIEVNEVGTAIGQAVDETPTATPTPSHGTEVATVLAGPVNNQYLTCGVLPGAYVVPVKVWNNPASIKGGIVAVLDAGIPDCKTINASYSFADAQFPLTFVPEIAGVVATAVGNGYSVVLPAGNYEADTDNPTSQNCPNCVPMNAGAIIVGGSEESGLEWISQGEGKGSSYGTYIDIAASSDVVPTVAYKRFSSGQRTRQLRLASGTSLASPMVAATVAMARNIYYDSGGALPESDMPWFLRTLVCGSANIAPTRTGRQLGRDLEVSSNNAGGAKMRVLNVANAYAIASHAGDNPLVRVTNTDYIAKWAINADWDTGISSGYSVDAIWDLSDVGLTSTSTLNFSTFNDNGTPRAHGYQVWRNAVLYWEHIGGGAELAYRYHDGQSGVFRGTIGEDNGSTDCGWHYTLSYPGL